MKFIPLKPEQIQTAKNTNIISYLSFHHPEIIVYNTTKKRYEHKEHDSLVIQANGWFWWSQNYGGDSIRFLTDFLNYEFPDAVLKLCRYNGTECDLSDFKGITKVNTPNGEKTQNKPFKMPQRVEKNFSKVESYLWNRGISKNTIRILKEKGLLFADEFSNCCFINENLSMIFRRGTGEKPFKRIDTKEMNDFWIFNPSQDIKRIFICESPIDAISLFEILPDELKHSSGFASIQGLKAATVNFIINTNTDKEIFLAVDWDEAGKTFAEEKFPFLKTYAAKPEFQNQCKDWNEYLQIKKGGKIWN